MIGRRSIPALLFVLCLFANAYFTTASNSNIVTRTALSLAIVQRHALDIGPQASQTVDKAAFDGRIYADKAPGLSLMATPVAFAGALLLDPGHNGAAWSDADGTLSSRFFLVAYLCGLGTVGLLSACATTALYVCCRARGTSAAAALFAAATLGFATPAWGFSTVFMGHAAAGALLLLGFLGLSSLIGRTGPTAGAWAAGTGLLLGGAFAVEFPAGPAVAIIGLSCFAASMLRGNRLAALRDVYIPAAAGVVLGVLPVLVYNRLAFGSPFALGYANVKGFTGMQTGFMGVSMPDPAVAVSLLFGLYRGLLPLAPVLLAAPLAMLAAWRHSSLRHPALGPTALGPTALRSTAWRLSAVVGTLVFAYYLCLNAGYYYWNGGSSTGPRHMVPCIPFLCLPLAILWDRARAARPVLLVLLLLSILVSLVCVSVETLAPEEVARPFFDLLLPQFLDGDMHRAILRRVPGIPGWILLPLFLLPACGLGWLLVRRTAEHRPGMPPFQPF